MEVEPINHADKWHFSPFSQRVWIALEAKGLPYQYCETDPYKKSTQLLEANPRGMVPAIRQGDWACSESAVILEYVSTQSSLDTTNHPKKNYCLTEIFLIA
jgi:glutathione S-transferase